VVKRREYERIVNRAHHRKIQNMTSPPPFPPIREAGNEEGERNEIKHFGRMSVSPSCLVIAPGGLL